MIHFTFNIPHAFKLSKTDIDYRDFSSNICEINRSMLIKQDKIYNRLPEKYRNNKGYCVIASIYNAFPIIFNNDINELVQFLIYLLDNNKKYSAMRTVCNEINNHYKYNILFSENNLNDSYNIFVNNILQNKPVAISYGYRQNFFIDNSKYNQHAVTLVGYDDNFIYYHDNSEDNYLYNSLKNYIIEYYNFANIEADNPERDRLTMVIKNKDYDLMKDILGFNEMYNLCSLKKCFLTNGKYFYDLNRLITYNNKIEYSEIYGHSLSDMTQLKLNNIILHC